MDSPHKEKAELPRVNLFLYQILPDAARRNALRIPIGKPVNARQPFAPEPLALNFRYLLTAFAEDGLSEHHRLLGEAMQVFHEHPYIEDDHLFGTLLDSDIRPARVQMVVQIRFDLPASTIYGATTWPPARLRRLRGFFDGVHRAVVAAHGSADRPARAQAGDRADPVSRIDPSDGRQARRHRQAVWREPSPAVPQGVARRIRSWCRSRNIRPRVARVEIPHDIKIGRRPIFLQFDRFQTNPIDLDIITK